MRPYVRVAVHGIENLVRYLHKYRRPVGALIKEKQPPDYA